MSEPRLSERTKREILAAYSAGEPLKEIAVRFGIDKSYPSLLARRRSVPLRSPVGRPGPAPRSSGVRHG